MAYNQKRTEQVRQALSHLPDVQEKKMFGSIGFIVNGKLCIGVGDHKDHIMMVRVGPDAYEEVLGKPGANPAIMRGREHPGYIFLTEEAVGTQADMEYWVELAIKYNLKLTSSK